MRALSERLWLIVLAGILAGGAAYLISLAIPPMYRASVSLLVTSPAPALPADGRASLTSGDRLTRTYGELARKRPILDEVNIGLDLPYTAERLASMIDVQAVPDTQVLVVAAESTDPRQARDIANRLAEALSGYVAGLYKTGDGDARQLLDQQIGNLERDIRSATQSIEALRKASPAGAGGDAQPSELARLQSSLAQSEATYAALLRDREQLRRSEDRARASLTVVEPADLPPRPFQPRPLLNAALAAAIGLLVTVGLVLLSARLDDSLRTPAALQRLTGLNALGAVRRFAGAAQDEQAPANGIDRSLVGEDYRMLRTAIMAYGADHPPRIILLTSAEPDEGATTTCAHLGEVLAKAGHTVALVDADLRRPSLHRFFSLSNSSGLTNLLLGGDGEGAAEKLLQTTSVDRLRLLSSGPLPPHPADLLASPRMAGVLRELGSQADVVLLDSPAVLSASDSAVLAAMVDGVIIVVDAGSRKAQTLWRVTELLSRARANILGAVLNKVIASGSELYYYEYDRPGSCGRNDRRPDQASPGLADRGRMAWSGRFGGERKGSS